MAKGKALKLACYCTDLLRAGNNFPIIWDTVLKYHPLIDGIPRERLNGQQSFFDISMITGQRLVFDGDAKEFRLE